MLTLLVIIYLAFISLGLPDSLLGSAWPVMYEGFGVSISSAGIISMTVAGGTIISSLFSGKLIRRAGTGPVTLASVGMTAIALWGISASTSFVSIFLWAIPLGLGAGSVDAALNNFVALHYKASHMNWLHGFWGIGTTIGPLVISAVLMRGGSWNAAYRLISILQLVLVAVLAFSLPLWKKVERMTGGGGEQEKSAPIGLRQAIALPKAKPTLLAFFAYCALEQTVMLWGSSYLVVVKSIKEDVAAGWISLFFVGITAGRLLSGFLSMKLTQKQLILLGEVSMTIGVLLFLLPLPSALLVAGFFLLGIGGAPIFPCLLHETPHTFGAANSQSMMGIQMASAYVGTTFMAPIFGLLAGKLGYALFPFYIGALLLIMAAMVGLIYRRAPKTAAGA